METVFHYTDDYILNPTHPISIGVVGCGGSGSQVLSNLARMNSALLELGHPGLDVVAYDHDNITNANVGRQLFSPADVGLNKAVVLISRINRFFGFAWRAVPFKYCTDLFKSNGSAFNNVVMSCVDSAASRIEISEIHKNKLPHYNYERPVYWIDLGNSRNTGQVILGTFEKVKQPSSKFTVKGKLDSIVELYPDLASHDNIKDQGPSCSLAEALLRQDLFINCSVSQAACTMLWKLLREARIKSQGVFINLETMVTTPLPITA